MIRRLPFALALLFIALAASPAASQMKKKKKPAPRPPAKSKVANPKPATGIKGTAQLPGDNGKLGQAYTMGIEGQLNFMLREAEYTVDRFNVGATCYSPTSDQKMMLVRFTVQNPNKSETLLRFDSFELTAVDNKNVNHPWIRAIIKDGEDKNPLEISLKPAQKIEVMSGIMLPADASAPKLMVQHPSGGKVLRYDLRGLVKPLAPPFADPAQSAGHCALKEIPAQKGVFCPMGVFDVQLVSAALGGSKLGPLEAQEEKRFLILSLTLKNGSNSPQHYRFDTFTARLIDTDGEAESLQGDLLRGTRNEQAEGDLAPGATYNCRFVLQIGRQVKPAKIVLSEGESHPYVFDITDAR